MRVGTIHWRHGLCQLLCRNKRPVALYAKVGLHQVDGCIGLSDHHRGVVSLYHSDRCHSVTLGRRQHNCDDDSNQRQQHSNGAKDDANVLESVGVAQGAQTALSTFVGGLFLFYKDAGLSGSAKLVKRPFFHLKDSKE